MASKENRLARISEDSVEKAKTKQSFDRELFFALLHVHHPLKLGLIPDLEPQYLRNVATSIDPTLCRYVAAGCVGMPKYVRRGRRVRLRQRFRTPPGLQKLLYEFLEFLHLKTEPRPDKKTLRVAAKRLRAVITEVARHDRELSLLVNAGNRSR